MTEQKAKIRYLLIDGNALVHRAFHALPGLTTKDGKPTGAVFGFLTIFLKAMKDIKATHVAATFDLAGPTFRHEKYKEYKGTRVKAAQELYDQIPVIKEVLRGMNVPIYEKQGYEADDVLGTLSKQLHDSSHDNAEIFILTGDMDTLQLVNSKVKVYTPRKGLTDTVVYDARAVRERYGLLPSQMVDYKALRGDPSDNIPGVKGIGEKTAANIIKEFGSIDNLYQTLHKELKEIGTEITNPKPARTVGQGGFQIPNKYKISNIKPRIISLLVEQEKEARLSYELSQIVCDVPGIHEDIKPYVLEGDNLQQTVKTFQRLEFKSLLAKLPKGEESGSMSQEVGERVREFSGEIGKQDYELVDTEEKLHKMLKEISGAKEICIDTETTSLNVTEAKLVGVGICVAAGKAFYLPSQIFIASEELRNILTSEKVKLVGHNIKYDLQVLLATSYQLRATFDTMLASYLLNAGTRQHGLDALAFNELGYQMQPIEELIGKGKNQITMDKVAPEKVSWYCCEDVDMTLRLKGIFEPELKKQGLEKVFYDIEMPLVSVLRDMELNGIKLDTKFLNKLASEAEIDIKDLEKKIHKLAGEEFNINSPLQLKKILFEKLGLEPIENRKTKTGISTAAGNLEKMLGQHEIVPKILEYREVTKLYSTYLTTLPGQVSKKTGRLHTSYNQTIAATGRLSSTDPNLQNIPVKGDGLGSQVRKAFVAEKGFKLLSLDYSQIELRIVAHLAKDKKMLEVFQKDEDIHSKTAVEIFNVPADKVTKDMRRDAKTINFGILYGVSSFGLSSRIGEVNRAEAKRFIEKYFAAYPQVEEYMENVKLQVNQTAFVKNELGRMRKFPEIRSSQFFIRAAAERAAINFPIQSLAADVIKVAMINIHRELESKKNSELDIKMLLQVHDELVFEVKEDMVMHYAKMLKVFMEEALSLSIPIKVEAKVGDSWGNMEPVSV
ncbi:MAG: DNA polymerase I [Candidatus Doudnabacteria bacterium]|nr:DNA polymerase I [Candidatus Doudnabacteria bacterium]